MSNPALACRMMTPGVASACRAKKPALVRNTSETRKSRASVWRRAVTLIRAPRTTFTPATTSTNQK
jgi:hypothetical protein